MAKGHSDAAEAARIGLVDFAREHTIALEARLLAVLQGIGRCAPNADAATKALFVTLRKPLLGGVIQARFPYRSRGQYPDVPGGTVVENFPVMGD